MPYTTPLELSAFRNGAATTVHVAGEIDIATSGRLQSFLREQLGDTREVITLQLSDITYFGSEALKVVLWLRGECVRRGIGFVLGDCSRAVLRAIELSGLTDVLFGEEKAARDAP